MRNLVILFICLGCSQIWGQEEMTLAKAIAIGLENNFDIKIAEKNIMIAENNNSWARAGKNPTVDLNGFFNHSFTNDNNPASFLQGSFYNSSLGATLDAQWLVLSGGRVQIAKDQFETLYQQERFLQEQTIHDQIKLISESYYTVLLQIERLELLEETYQLSKDRFAYEQTKKEFGSSNSFNLIQFQNAVVSDSTNLISQNIQIEIAKRNLFNVLDELGFPDYQFSEDLATTVEDIDPENLKKIMSEENYTLKSLDMIMSLNLLNTKLEQSARKPTVGINGSIGLNENAFKFFEDNPQTGEPFELLFSNRFSASLGANLNWNLYDGGVKNANIKNAKLQEEITGMNILQAKAALNNQLDILIANYNNQKELLEISDIQIQLAKQNLEMTEERFKSGQISSLDYRNVQNQFLSAAFNKINAIYNLINSKLEIDYLVGSFEQ